MGTNHSENLIKQCVEALLEKLAADAENAGDMTIEVTHLDVCLYQPVGCEFTLEDLRAMMSDVQKLGMKWVDRAQRVRWRELGARKHYFYYDARLYEGERPFVKFIFGLSPFDLLYYLETYEKHEEHQAKTLDEGMVTIYTLDGRGLIPIGASAMIYIGINLVSFLAPVNQQKTMLPRQFVEHFNDRFTPPREVPD